MKLTEIKQVYSLTLDWELQNHGGAMELSQLHDDPTGIPRLTEPKKQAARKKAIDDDIEQILREAGVSSSVNVEVLDYFQGSGHVPADAHVRFIGSKKSLWRVFNAYYMHEGEAETFNNMIIAESA